MVIANRYYSWEEQAKNRRRRRFLIRWLVVVPLILVLLAAGAAWAGWEMLSAHYNREVQKFDLAQLDKMEAASVIFDRHGKELAKVFILNRNPVEWERISPMMVNAIVAIEDNRFFSHKGVDWAGIARAAIANYRSGRINQGASTVTQQLARNTFDLKERTYQRKITEVFLARRIEESFSKQDIMRLYLNRVYFGSGFYGIESAARGYFGKSAADLNAGQAAMLAGLLKSPQALSPWNNHEAATEVRNFGLKRMREMGFLTRAEYRDAVAEPLQVIKRTNPFKTSYAVDLIRQKVIAALGFDRAMNGGFQIHSTLDSRMQRAARDSVRETLARVEAVPGYSHETFAQFSERVKAIEKEIDRGNMAVKMPQPRYLQAAVLAVDSASGAIRAMVGGREFKHSEYNRATQARRPTGTAFTPFVFAAAYEGGVFPGGLVEDACIDNRYVMVGGESGILGEWGVERADNAYEGNIPLREALAKGKNAATVRVGFLAGLDAVGRIAKACGISSALRPFANAFLGSSEASLEELTLAYTVFPNGGMRPERLFLIDRITDASGQVVFQNQTSRVPAMSPEAAFQTHRGLEEALHRGTGAISASYGLGDFPAAGKTGTAYNFTDTYFMGYDSSVTCGVWVGFDKPTRIFRGAFGKDLALPIWTQIMNAAAKEFPAVRFNRPDTLQEVEVCRMSGLLATPGCAQAGKNPATGAETETSTIVKEYATEAQIPKIPCDIHGSGIRTFTKEFLESDWPRAQVALDLSRIRPVAVNSPALLGLTDVYGSVQAGGRDAEIPVARAIPVSSTPDAEPASTATSEPVYDYTAPPPFTITSEPIRASEVGAPGEDNLPVRRAEAVHPPGNTSPEAAPAISAPTPPPIRF